LVIHIKGFLKMYKCISSGWALVAHACNLSYSGGRDQEVCDSKPAQTNSLRDPMSKIPNTKKGWFKL
jgi:hypothetical protein